MQEVYSLLNIEFIDEAQEICPHNGLHRGYPEALKGQKMIKELLEDDTKPEN